MSRNLAQLCTLVVEDLYGTLYSTIFSALTIHSRLSAGQIAQRCRLPLRQVFRGLALLVQQRFVYYHTESDGQTIYEANTSTAFDVLRMGRLIQTARCRLGNENANILKELILLGHAQPGDLEDCLEQPQNPGLDKRSYLKRALQRLADHLFISLVRGAHFQSPTDARRDAEVYVQSQLQTTSTKGKKGQQLLDANVDRELSERLTVQVPQLEGQQPPETSKKRHSTATGDSPRSKRIKGTDGTAHELRTDRNGNLENEGPDQQTIQPSISRATNALRTSRLILHAEKSFGSLAGQVLAAALEQIHEKEYDGFHTSAPIEEGDETGRSVAIDVDRLLLDVNARDYLVVDQRTAAETLQNRESRLISDTLTGLDANASGANGHVNGDLDNIHQDPISPQHIEEQLEILSEPPCAFVQSKLSDGGWIIDLTKCRTYLREIEINNFIRARFGQIAMRVIRILSERGRVEERWLQEISLCSARDLRQTLAKLKSHGFVELQEVPREPQHQPNRTIFLWFYNSEQIRKNILEDAYKGVSRLLQRMSRERRRIKTTLDKVERSDVKGREDLLLPPDEFRVLRQWRRRERWMWVEIDRLDGTIALLADG